MIVVDVPQIAFPKSESIVGRKTVKRKPPSRLERLKVSVGRRRFKQAAFAVFIALTLTILAAVLIPLLSA